MMKIFVTSALVGLLFGLLFILIKPLSLQGEQLYSFQWPIDIAKHKRTLFQQAQYEQPSIVLVGGSSLLYSVDTQTLQAQLNQPVFNFGLGAVVGLEVLLDLVSPSIRDGDTVILVLENELMSKGKTSFSGAIMNHLLDEELFSSQTALDKVKLLWKAPLKALSGDMDGTRNELFMKIYQPASLNKHGDLMADLIGSTPPKYPFPDKAMTPTFSLHPDTPVVLKKVVNRWRERGVTVLAMPAARYAFTTSPQTYYQTERAIMSMYDSLNIPYLSHFSHHEFSSPYIYDSSDHINLKGRTVNTQKMLTALKHFKEEDPLAWRGP